MSKEEAVANLNMISVAFVEPVTKEQRKLIDDTFDMAIQALEQEPCDDVVSREAVMGLVAREHDEWDDLYIDIAKLPPVTPKSGKCKNCKYFEYDSVAKVNGVPLIVAHEICNKWGDGCQTSEDGYCFLFEPQESEVRNEIAD